MPHVNALFSASGYSVDDDSREHPVTGTVFLSHRFRVCISYPISSVSVQPRYPPAFLVGNSRYLVIIIVVTISNVNDCTRSPLGEILYSHDPSETSVKEGGS